MKRNLPHPMPLFAPRVLGKTGAVIPLPLTVYADRNVKRVIGFGHWKSPGCSSPDRMSTFAFAAEAPLSLMKPGEVSLRLIGAGTRCPNHTTRGSSKHSPMDPVLDTSIVGGGTDKQR